MDKWNGEGEVEATKNRKLLYSLSSSVLHEYSRPSVLPSFVSTDIVSIPHFLEVFFFPSPLFPSLPFHRESFSMSLVVLFQLYSRGNNSTRRIRFHAGGIGHWPFVGATFTWTPICWNVLLLRDERPLDIAMIH